METPKIIDDKKTRRYQAGDVVVMKYDGDGRPCDKAMAILITPITTKGDVIYGAIHTMYAIDTDKEEFLKSGNISSTTCTIAKATPKLKAWFFEQIVKRFQKPAEPKPIWVLFAESLYDYEIVRRVINVFENEDDARKAFAEEVKEARKCATTNEWVIGNDNENFFEAYPDGSWGTSHETVELNQTVMNEKITCRN